MKESEFAFRFIDKDGNKIESESGFSSIGEMSNAILASPTFLLDSWEIVEVKSPKLIRGKPCQIDG